MLGLAKSQLQERAGPVPLTDNVAPKPTQGGVTPPQDVRLFTLHEIPKIVVVKVAPVLRALAKLKVAAGSLRVIPVGFIEPLTVTLVYGRELTRLVLNVHQLVACVVGVSPTVKVSL
jgi:hypothetical protein